MRKVTLLYNPTAGKNRERRRADVDAAAQVLRAAGIETVVAATRSPGTAGEQAREATAQGSDAVLACGGDGTVHDVLQGLVGTDTALGVIPLGTGNSLGNDLGLSRDPVQASEAMLTAEPRRISVGRIDQLEGTGAAGRYFIVIAGAGVDARMLYQMNVAAKQRHGMLAYYAEAAHLFLTHRFQRFQVEFTDCDGRARSETVTQLMAVRLRQFGGILRHLAPEAALETDDLQLILFRTANRISYCLYILRAMMEQRWQTPGVDRVCAREVVCRALPGEPSANVYAEADGEILGGLPVKISVVPKALTLLFPR